jgi:hypothetical protein
MTWKHLAKKSNSLPPGWSTTDEIAADLDCEPGDVAKILAASIREGLVEKQTFPHWQEGSRQLLYQTGYRQAGKTKQVSDKTQPAKSKPTTTQAVPGIPAHLLDRVRQTCVRYRHLRPSEIAARCRWKGELKLSSTAIRALLDKLAL